MTVGELSKKCDFVTVCMPDPDREVSGCYIGDLLSWVMGRAQSGNAWITIMSNVNIAAVASLTDAAVIILAEGVILDESVVTVAEQKGINIVSSDAPAFETAVKLCGNV